MDDIPECIRRDANNRAPFMDGPATALCHCFPPACTCNVTVLAPEAHDAFLKALDNPPAPNEALINLLKGPQASFPWELPPSLATS